MQNTFTPLMIEIPLHVSGLLIFTYFNSPNVYFQCFEAAYLDNCMPRVFTSWLMVKAWVTMGCVARMKCFFLWPQCIKESTVINFTKQCEQSLALCFSHMSNNKSPSSLLHILMLSSHISHGCTWFHKLLIWDHGPKSSYCKKHINCKDNDLVRTPDSYPLIHNNHWLQLPKQKSSV